VKNNISWGNVAQKYTTMFNFQNRAVGGRNSVTFYNQGKLDGILLDVKPKDVVTFNGMGTNGFNNYFKDHINYAIDGVLQRGGIAVIVTYTPHGAVSNWSNGYDSKTQTFKSARDNDGYTKIYREIAANRQDVYFIDLGNLVNDQYNQMVIAARNKITAKGGSNTDAWAAGEAEAQRIIKMFNDHNHYHDEMADIIAPIMVEKIETLYKKVK
jgi:lysophospholipase L1-like esterase